MMFLQGDLVLHSHAFLTEITWQVLMGDLTLLLLVHKLTFGLKSIGYDYVRILKVSVLQAMST